MILIQCDWCGTIVCPPQFFRVTSGLDGEMGDAKEHVCVPCFTRRKVTLPAPDGAESGPPPFPSGSVR